MSDTKLVAGFLGYVDLDCSIDADNSSYESEVTFTAWEGLVKVDLAKDFFIRSIPMLFISDFVGSERHHLHIAHQPGLCSCIQLLLAGSLILAVCKQ